jgi:hypothetical protein
MRMTERARNRESFNPPIHSLAAALPSPSG